jgi:hypothetical protein
MLVGEGRVTMPPNLAGADRVAIGWLSSAGWDGGQQVWAIYERRA